MSTYITNRNGLHLKRGEQEMRIDVSNYIFKHGKQPIGRGEWAFDFHVPKCIGAGPDRLKVVTESAPGGYQLWRSAKRWAFKRGIQLNAYRIETAT